MLSLPNLLDHPGIGSSTAKNHQAGIVPVLLFCQFEVGLSRKRRMLDSPRVSGHFFCDGVRGFGGLSGMEVLNACCLIRRSSVAEAWIGKDQRRVGVCCCASVWDIRFWSAVVG